MKQFVLTQNRKWLTPLLLGMFVPMCIWLAVKRIHPPVDRATAAAARVLHIDPQVYNDMRNMAEQVDYKRGDLSASQWQRLTNNLKASEPYMQYETLAVMSRMRYSKYRNDAINQARPFLDSRTLILEVIALHVLRNLRAADWRYEVSRRAKRQEPDMKEAVKAMLQQEDL